MAWFFRKKARYPENSKPVGHGWFRGVAVSDVGRLRPNNEDNYLLGPFRNPDSRDHAHASIEAVQTFGHWQLAGVFDGMGGGEAGELASLTAANVFFQAAQHLESVTEPEQACSILRTAFLEANNQILDLQRSYRVYGTTATVVLMGKDGFRIFHLGDSRAYLLRADVLVQLTRDQTLERLKLEMGMYSPEDPQAQADRHKLTEYIGRDQTRMYLRPLESDWEPAVNGDRLILCSDGFYEGISGPQLCQILGDDEDMLKQAETMVALADRQDGSDNITCMVLKCTCQSGK